jgi:thiaminase/transcriptional activator TenA
MSAGLARALWAEHRDLAQAALAHPFVRGLATGALPRAVFAGYVAQDAWFLEAFARAYALAGEHCPDEQGRAAFARLRAGVTEELRLHRGYAARWGVDLATVRPHAATTAYTTFLLDIAAGGDTGRTCAALAPCMRLYAFLGRELEAAADPDTPYREWIATYASPDFAALAAELDALLDAYAAPGAPVRETYRTAMTLELAFFDAAYGTVAR